MLQMRNMSTECVQNILLDYLKLVNKTRKTFKEENSVRAYWQQWNTRTAGDTGEEL
jgi:hypothetical protein